MNKQFIVGLMLVALWLGGARGAKAQSALISVDLAPSSPPIRSDAPMTFVWRIRSQSSKLVEGQLDVTIHDGPEVLGHGVADDVVLTAGEQLVRMVLPPIESNIQFNSFELRVSFFSNNVKLGSWDLTLQAPSQSQRYLVILVCDPWQSNLSADIRQLVESLRVDTWNADSADRTIRTVAAHVRPDDLPNDSLGLCGYDQVILAHEGLAELKESQLKTILEWVEAGGSLCLVPGHVVLKDYHASFLNRAARYGDSDPRFVIDPGGRLMPPGTQDEGTSDKGEHATSALLRPLGLGRIAIVRGKLDRLFNGPAADLRKMTAFLWKLRRDRLAEFLESGSFLVKSEVPVDEPKQGENEWQGRNFNVSYANLRLKDRQLASLPLQSGDQLLTRLMPEGLRVVPMSLIGVILIVYVLLIGPGDWFALGAIKRRKWTWITFPCVTVALTLVTVWLAEWYMQISSNRRAVTFHDVGDNGRIARRNRFEVLFQGSEGNVTTELTREIFSPMTLQRFSSGMWYNYQQQQLRGVDQRRLYTQVANVAGRMPARYTVTQFLSQWTPQLNRRFSIPRVPTQSAAASGDLVSAELISPGPEKPPAFDWDMFADANVYNPKTLTAVGVQDEPILRDNLRVRGELVRLVKQAFGESTHIAVFLGGKRQNLSGNFSFFQSGQIYGIDANGNQINTQMYPGYNPGAKQTEFLDDVSVNELGGLFAVVSQLSPTGGKDFEDMALVDPTDPDQWLLVVAVERGDDVDLYRKLYTNRGD